MNPSENIGSLAEAYLDGQLPADQQSWLKEKIAQDPAFALEFNEMVELLLALRAQGKRKAYRRKLQAMARKKEKGEAPAAAPVISLQKHYFRTALVAAAIALITSLGSFWLVQNNQRQMESQYRLLKRDIENYKRTQDRGLTPSELPAPDPVRYTGTGFAIADNGYLVTNYHLTEGADSIFIQTGKQAPWKTRVVAVDAENDVAILQVEAPEFRFSDQQIPYTIMDIKRPLGTPIFTLGFPQEEIVYHEGYVSSTNGFQGDSMQYRLNLPSAPGQSGAPVLDRSGLLIGIITGKESLSEGTTYAVSTQALLDLIDRLGEEEAFSLPRKNRLKGLKPDQQIRKMEAFTFAVKVYKN